MKTNKDFEYPQHLVLQFKKAKKLEWLTIAYLLFTITIIYLTMGSSQAMKTAWFEDLLSLTPPISFLIAAKIYHRPVSEEFPYGYNRIITIAYLCSSLALFSFGTFLFLDSGLKLVEAERPTIGSVFLFGQQVWQGYLMMLALTVGTIPAVFLGRAKLPLAKELHEKNLYADAEIAKADWMTGAAGIIGILGIGLGWWWADAAAAAFISINIIYDGYNNLKQATADLMNQAPKTVTHMEADPLIEEIQKILKEEPWIKEVQLRLREEGHVIFGEACVIAQSEDNLTAHIKDTQNKIYNLNWRIQDFGITPVDNLIEE